MSRGIKLRVWGEFALFCRPEMKVERCTYDMITPSAARGILEAIYWHPGMKWVIDTISVQKPIRFTSIRRNEVQSKISANNVLTVINGGDKPLYLCTKKDIAQRAAILLKDVEYIIEAHFKMTKYANPDDNPGKFEDIILRRVTKGQCYHRPYLGCREFPAQFELYDQKEISNTCFETEKDLGYMLYDFDYSNPEEICPMFFRAVLKNGKLDLRNCEVVR